VEKNNNNIITVLLILIIVILLLGGYIFYNKTNLKEDITNNSTTSNISKESADDRYKNYLENLKSNIKDTYSNKINNYIFESSDYLEKGYQLKINKEEELLLTIFDNSKYTNYKISNNVLTMYIVGIGTGGYKSVYFIKEDGKVYSVCIDSLSTNQMEIKEYNYKNIVNITGGSFEDEYSGTLNPIFIDIDGNIITE